MAGRILVAEHDGVYMIKFEGDVRLTLCATVDDYLDRMFADENFHGVVVDLNAVPFVDSRGLEVLVEANDVLAEGGRSLKLCGVNETIREVLDLTGLAQRFDHFADTNSALRSFH